jgi:hypothetical protein
MALVKVLEPILKFQADLEHRTPLQYSFGEEGKKEKNCITHKNRN